MYMCTLTHKHTCMHAYIHTCIHICVYMHYMYIDKYTCKEQKRKRSHTFVCSASDICCCGSLRVQLRVCPRVPLCVSLCGLSVSRCVSLSVWLSVCLSVCVSLCVSVCRSVCSLHGFVRLPKEYEMIPREPLAFIIN